MGKLTKINSNNFAAPADINKKHDDVRVLIGDLTPGVHYNFDIHTISYNLISDVTQLSKRTLPLIQSEVLVVNNHGERDTVTLSYTPTPQTSSKFDKYRFSLGDPDIPEKEKLANDTDRKVTFTGKLLTFIIRLFFRSTKIDFIHQHNSSHSNFFP